MKPTLTKKFRKKFYTLMLEDLKASGYGMNGYCTTATNVACNIGDRSFSEALFSKGLIVLPELYAYKPKKFYRYGTYWWSPYTKTKRIEVLKEIIASMK